MTGNDEDDAWRAIVDNYGERPRVDDPPPRPEPAPEPFLPTYADLDAPDPADRFVPPEPPPAPALRLPQHLPWVGVFGAPALLLVALMTGIELPGWVGYLLVVGFVGGFCWLVATMRRGGRDPWDDGARL